MLSVTYLSKGKLATKDIDELKSNGEIWIDCYDPTRHELKKVAEKTGIHYEDLHRSLDEDERPNISSYDEFSIITLHAPLLNKMHNYITVPFSIFIKKNYVVILRKKPVEAVDKIHSMDDKTKIEILQQDITYTIYMIASELVNHFFRVTDEMEAEIDRIEDNVFKKQSERTVKQIFGLKKTLIYFHKSLTGNREVIAGIEKQFLAHLKGKNLRKFRYLYGDFMQLIDMTATYREVLTSSLDIYLTSVSNNLNNVVKRLTVVASFVLVPTLISGIYGMNFEFMPEIHILGKWGYPFAIGLMIFSTMFIYFYFKWQDWI